ncbi:MAG: hypothetical protein AAF846_21820 [Chloroflexota bacterium]
MYIDPWQWFRDFQWQAVRNSHFRLLRLPELYHAAWRHLENARYPQALDTFAIGVHLAQELQQPMWVFFFKSWICEVQVLSADYKSALDTTTRLVAQSVKPEYQDHPVRAAVYFTLAWVYFYVDTHGYHKDIIQALDALENDMLLDEETHHRSLFLRAELAFELDLWDDALSQSNYYMTLVEGNAYRQASGYGMQRSVAFAKGDLETALSANQLREKASRQASLLNNAVNCVLWDGVLHQYLGHEQEAKATIERGKAEYESLNLDKKTGYYHLLAEYETACGNYELALTYRTQQAHKHRSPMRVVA